MGVISGVRPVPGWLESLPPGALGSAQQRLTCAGFLCCGVSVALKRKVNISWQADNELFAIDLAQPQTADEQGVRHLYYKTQVRPYIWKGEGFRYFKLVMPSAFQKKDKSLISAPT